MTKTQRALETEKVCGRRDLDRIAAWEHGGGGSLQAASRAELMSHRELFARLIPAPSTQSAIGWKVRHSCDVSTQ